MRKKLKDELESRNTVQEYACPNCSKRYLLLLFVNFISVLSYISYNIIFFVGMGSRYTALDALMLISPNDEYFHCERCDGILVAESAKLGSQELGDGDERHRHNRVKDLLAMMEASPLLSARVYPLLLLGKFPFIMLVGKTEFYEI